jgi:hypothetical protein
VNLVGNVARSGDKNTSLLLARKPGRNGLLDRPRRRWENTVKMDFKGTEWEGVGLIYLIQDRDEFRALVYTPINIRFL